MNLTVVPEGLLREKHHLLVARIEHLEQELQAQLEERRAEAEVMLQDLKENLTTDLEVIVLLEVRVRGVIIKEEVLLLVVEAEVIIELLAIEVEAIIEVLQQEVLDLALDHQEDLHLALDLVLDEEGDKLLDKKCTKGG